MKCPRRTTYIQSGSSLFVGRLITIISGCGTFSGNINFQNKSDRYVWVAHDEGFRTEPPVGSLRSGLGKHADMGDTSIPHEVVIHWSYKANRSDYTTKLLIDDSKMPGSDDKLVFRFTNDRKWEASIMR